MSQILLTKEMHGKKCKCTYFQWDSNNCSDRKIKLFGFISIGGSLGSDAVYIVHNCNEIPLNRKVNEKFKMKFASFIGRVNIENYSCYTTDLEII
jgi:hypothetical protein